MALGYCLGLDTVVIASSCALPATLFSDRALPVEVDHLYLSSSVPSVVSGVFSGGVTDNTIIHVPCAAVEAYAGDAIWGGYPNLRGSRVEVVATHTACGSYTLPTGDTFYVDTVVTYAVPDALCDSVVTLYLTVNHADSTAFTATACDSYTWNGSTYTVSGDYVQTFQNENGCDSTVTLHLTVSNADSTEFSATACGSYAWNDSIYTMSGDYVQVFETIHGCDSVVTLHLTIGSDLETTLYDTICQGGDYDAYGFSVTDVQESDTLVQHLTSLQGCDSTVTLLLTMMPTYSILIEDTVSKGADYSEHGFALTNVQESATYTQELTTLYGCDSIVTLHLTVQDVSIDEAARGEAFSATLYPNPTDDRVTVQEEHMEGDATIRIYDELGRMMLSQKLRAGEEKLTLDVSHLAAGSYHVRVAAAGSSIVRKLVVR